MQQETETVADKTLISPHTPRIDPVAAPVFCSLDQPYQLRVLEVVRQVEQLGALDRIRVMLKLGMSYTLWAANQYGEPVQWPRLVTATIELLGFPNIETAADALLYRMADAPGWRLQVDRWAQENGHARLFEMIDAANPAVIEFISGDDEEAPHVLH